MGPSKGFFTCTAFRHGRIKTREHRKPFLRLPHNIQTYKTLEDTMKFCFRQSAFIFVWLLTPHCSLAQKEHRFRHEVVNNLPRRNAIANATTTEACSLPSRSSTPVTTIYPSPGARPIEVFNQSQVVTSFIPEATWCVGPPIGLVATATILGPPYLNASTLYSTTVAGTGSCETIYAPTTTTVCATTLTGLASKVSEVERYQNND